MEEKIYFVIAKNEICGPMYYEQAVALAGAIPNAQVAKSYSAKGEADKLKKENKQECFTKN